MSDAAPAEGERNVIAGLGFQYGDVAAALIYRALLDGEGGAFESASFVDPRAGKVDDVQITTRDLHHAYQVKWESKPTGVTLRSLTVALEGEVPPLQQLYDGWVRLRNQHGRPVRVHWVTNAPASTARERKAFVGKGDARPAVATMAAFLNEVHRPFVEHGTPVPDRWATTWESLRNSLGGVSEADFNAFMRDCRFDLGYTPIDPVGPLDALRRRRDEIQRLWAELFERVRRSQRGERVDIRRDDPILASLVARLQLTSPHDFPAPDIPLVESGTTLEQLNVTVNGASGGYAGLLGSPGAGKSTLLSAFARARERSGDLVVQYYAYTTDSDPGAALRAESEHFLRDLVLMLHRKGVGDLTSVPGTDHASLLKVLHDQLAELGRRYRDQGIRSLLIVDGLDHVPRAHPRHGFLADLPRPAQLPDGVTIVVGTQTEQLPHLPPAVQAALASGAPGRVEVVPLTVDEVAYVLDNAEGLPPLPSHAVQTALERTEGHRLALALLVHRLRDVHPEEEANGTVEAEVETALQEAALPDPLYERLWADVGNDFHLQHLLALAARVPGPIDLAWFRTWITPAAVQQLYGPLRHLFRREDDTRWFFFHDSARVFVLEKTAALMPGAWNRDLHRELAEHSRNSPPPHAWNELFHRDLAGDREGVVRLARPSVVRKQFVAFRHPTLIRDDLDRAAAYVSDPLDAPLLVSIATASFEVARRTHVLDNYSSDAALRLARYGRLDEAARRSRTGRTLHVSPQTALALTRPLVQGGYAEDARRLYDLARPRDLLATDERIEDTYDGQQHARLRAWAGAAPGFESLADIAEAIGRVSIYAKDLPHWDRAADASDDVASHNFRRALFVNVADMLADEGRWDDLLSWVVTHPVHALPEEIDDVNGGDFAAGHRDLAHVEARIRSATHQPPPDAATTEELLRPLRNAPGEVVAWAVRALDAELAALGAEAIFSIGADAEEVIRWIPSFPSDPDHPPAWLYRLKDTWFRSARLLTLLDRPLPPLRKLGSKPGSEGFDRFRHAVARLARLSAAARGGNRHDAISLADELEPIFSSFPNARLSVLRTTAHPDWTDHPNIVQARAWLYATALDVAAEHSPDARDALLARVAPGASSPGPAIDNRVYAGLTYWTFEDAIALAEAAHRTGAAPAAVRSLLRPLEDYAASHEDADSRTDQLLDLSWAWQEVGDPDTAFRLLQRAWDGALGVGYRKDYQLADLASLLGWLLDHDPDSEASARRISRLAHAIAISVEGAETAPASAAASTLIAAVFGWRPPAGVALAVFFAKHGVGWEPVVTLNLLREAVSGTPTAVPLAVDVFADHILPERRPHGGLTSAYPDFTEALIRAATPDDAVQVARHLHERLDALAEDGTLASDPDEWKQGIGVALRALEHEAVANSLGISPPDVPAATFEDDSPVLDIEGEHPIYWKDLMARTTDEGLFQTLEADYEREQVSVWAHLISTTAPTISVDDLRAVAKFVDARPELARPDVYTALFRAFAAAGRRDDGWAYGEALLYSTRGSYDPWASAYGGGPGYRAAETLLDVDPERARPILLRLLALDAARLPGNVFRWLSTYLPLLDPAPDPAETWSPVEEYLQGLFPSASADAIPLPGSTDAVVDPRDGLVRYLLTLLPDSSNAHRLGPALLGEFRRHPEAHRAAVYEVLQGHDDMRRPLLRILAKGTAENPRGLDPLLNSLEAAAADLPSDLRHYAEAAASSIRQAER